MANVIVILLVIMAVVAALYHIRKERKRGRHCMGCPSAATCHGTCDRKDSGKDRQ